MDDKHEPGLEHTDPDDAIAKLAELDPAEAPAAAEELAADLASELESAGAPPTEYPQPPKHGDGTER